MLLMGRVGLNFHLPNSWSPRASDVLYGLGPRGFALNEVPPYFVGLF